MKRISKAQHKAAENVLVKVIISFPLRKRPKTQDLGLFHRFWASPSDMNNPLKGRETVAGGTARFPTALIEQPLGILTQRLWVITRR
jgi:hypothetical protein